jgi:predicted nuclease with TOPRIM domain
VLVGLFEEPERPESGVDYIRKYVGDNKEAEIEALKQEIESLKTEKFELLEKVKELEKSVFKTNIFYC